MQRALLVRLRMKVFGATVSQTLLYGAGTWMLNKERERKLRTAQRSMLRSMMMKQRREANKESSNTKAEMRTDEGLEGEEEELEESEEEEEEEKEKTEEEEEEKEEKEEKACGEELEPWHEWVQRVTKMAVKEMEQAKVEDWVEAARRKIWTLAGHISRRDDGRWSTIMLEWEPADGKRRSGKPLKRWSEDVNKYVAANTEVAQRGAWRLLAEDRDEWREMAAGFAAANRRDDHESAAEER